MNDKENSMKKRKSDGSTLENMKKVRTEETEKRLLPFRPKPSAATRDRIHRALNQRLYLLEAKKNPSNLMEREFKVLGHTGNVYTIEISLVPKCDCPDHLKGFLCKHIIFVLHRVLKVQSYSPLIYQRALLSTELEEIFSRADRQNQDSTVFPEKSIIDGYQTKLGEKPSVKQIHQRQLTEDDECPICFESIFNEKSNLIFCSNSCGNNLHKTCFERWKNAKASMGQNVSCPFCRVLWNNNQNQRENSRNSYLNLASYSTTNQYETIDDELTDDDDSPFYYRPWRF